MVCKGWVVRVVVVVLCNAVFVVVVVVVCVSVGALRSSLCVHSKRSRVYNSKRLHVCRQNARVSCDTRAF